MPLPSRWVVLKAHAGTMKAGPYLFWIPVWYTTDPALRDAVAVLAAYRAKFLPGPTIRLRAEWRETPFTPAA